MVPVRCLGRHLPWPPSPCQWCQLGSGIKIKQGQFAGQEIALPSWKPEPWMYLPPETGNKSFGKAGPGNCLVGQGAAGQGAMGPGTGPRPGGKCQQEGACWALARAGHMRLQCVLLSPLHFPAPCCLPCHCSAAPGVRHSVDTACPSTLPPTRPLPGNAHAQLPGTCHHLSRGMGPRAPFPPACPDTHVLRGADGCQDLSQDGAAPPQEPAQDAHCSRRQRALALPWCSTGLSVWTDKASHLQAKPFLSHYFIPPTLMWWILEGDLSAKLSESYSCGLAAAACCPPWLRQCLTKARPSPADVSRAARLLLPVEQERCGYPAHGTRHHPLLRDPNTPSTEPSAHGLGSLTRSRGTGRGARRIHWGHSARGPSPR